MMSDYDDLNRMQLHFMLENEFVEFTDHIALMRKMAVDLWDEAMMKGMIELLKDWNGKLRQGEQLWKAFAEARKYNPEQALKNRIV